MTSPESPSVAKPLTVPTVAGLAGGSPVLTPEWIAALRGSLSLSQADRLRQNAVTNNDIGALALNRQVLGNRDGHFSHRIRIKGVTNQKKSGRCWMFAALNTLRPRLIRNHGMEDFEFSVAYLQFWDKLERANLFLEEVIELRDRDYLDREWEMMSRHTLHEGGWWNFLVALVEKYGVVPREVMPETQVSADTGKWETVFRRLVMSRAARMLDRHADGAGIDELRQMKVRILEEVYRLLVISFGEPPVEFGWRFKMRQPKSAAAESDDASWQVESRDLAVAETFTPKSFYDRFVGRSLADFVCLYNDPKNGYHRHFEFDRARNVAGAACMGFVNVSMDEMKQAAVRSILDDQPMWFAVNMGIDQSKELGMMQHRLFDYETLFGTDLSLNKTDRARFHADVSNHAMALIGVDLDGGGKPVKWLVENSWGDKEGDGGLWTIHDEWFDEHVYTIIVDRRHVPDEVLRCFDEVPTVLPAWYPGAAVVS